LDLDIQQDFLKLYASPCPIWGNVVGLEVAAWRYLEYSQSFILGGDSYLGRFAKIAQV